MNENIIKSFVSQKINKIRWTPGQTTVSTLITGSWDDVVSF